MHRYRISPDSKINLRDIDPNDQSAYPKLTKENHQRILNKYINKLEELQELLFAENKHRVLIVLQAMDTAGKDGTIRCVFDGVNPAGVKVAAFKKPTPEELAHDYLWRVHSQVPANGQMTIFNRSHYEDVLVVRVHNLVPKERWEKRYDQINAFEKMLSDEGTTILKFYLHIDKDEQKKRLEARLAEPEKNWKFATADLAERKLWDDYMDAYEAVLRKTSSEYAPWYVVPANRKWYRNLVIANILVETLKGLNMQYPAPEAGLDKIVVE